MALEKPIETTFRGTWIVTFMILFVALNRYLVSGLSLGAVKG